MDYERLGAFYLGREADSEDMSASSTPFLYDSSDLTTHAVIVGMTGSGKTGLGIGLIEEAAIDGVPVLAIDPKGDLTNLALTFPNLQGSDFEPWIDPREAERSGTDLSTYAAEQARHWREGLASWDQGGDRIERLRAAATVTVYTPGSSAGRPISVLRSFAAPPDSLLADEDLFVERVATTVTGLLTLLQTDADPLGREHILLASLIEHYWRAGRDLDIAELVQSVQTPPFDRIGVMSLETVFAAKDRLKLAMALNALLAAPSFAAWTQGEPLDIQALLYEKSGKPRIAVISLNHLDDAERMFFLALLLGEVLTWTRSQNGTGSLRALVYVDELFGLLPPVAEPPSKKPLLTLLKQARAFGVGLALATQNPVDLDYKALSNAGTWFIGRLQTERDLNRLLDGLSAADGGTDNAALAGSIARLPKRTFLQHSVHERAPVIFQTRWVLSYLAGPLSREQIRRLAQPGEQQAEQQVEQQADSESARPGGDHAPSDDAGHLPSIRNESGSDDTNRLTAGTARPFLPPHVDQVFIAGQALCEGSEGPNGVRYFPHLLAVADVHYSSKKHGVEHGRRVARLLEPVEEAMAVDWSTSEEVALDLDDLSREPVETVSFTPLPALRTDERAVKSWRDLFARWLRTDGALELLHCAEQKLTSRPGEPELEFRLRCAQAVREARDETKGKLRERYGRKLTTLERRILRDEQAVGRERQQLQHRAVDTVGSLVGALFGGSRSTKISAAIRKASSGTKDLGDVKRAQERLAQTRLERADLEAELAASLAELEAMEVRPDQLELEPVMIKPVGRDVVVHFIGVAWVAHSRENGS